MSNTRIPKRTKKAVVRAGFRCEYCKAPKSFAPSPFNIDHVIPEALGGTSDFDNLAIACENCNGCKSDKISAIDPLTGIEVLLFNPRKENWNDHFVWSEGDLLISGLTPSGRATMETLKLNHQAIVNMRMLLKMVGEHPPGD